MSGPTVTIDDGEITQEVEVDDYTEERGYDVYSDAADVVSTALEGDGDYYDISVDDE